MSLPRRRLLAGGGVLLAGAVASVASSPSRGIVEGLARRVSAVVARRAGRAAPPTSVTISIDPARVVRPISPLIYGVAHANADQLVALGAQLNRWGGNANTRYNWVNGAWNAARDYEFRNYGWNSGQPQPPGTATDHFIDDTRGVGAEAELTVPAMGWVARNGNKQVQSVGVPADGGPPLSSGSEAIAGYDPTDNRRRTSLPSLARKGSTFADAPDQAGERVYQDEWIHHLVDRFGRARDGGVRYYIIDNEPDLWSTIHTDVHPQQAGYDEVLAAFLDYASAIKQVDPDAKIAGPALSGWTGYFYSARDRGTDRYQTHADRWAHGNTPFLAWWLDQVHTHDSLTGQRLLDVLDVHYYPQAAGVFGVADDPATRGLRLRSTRSLWDPTYVDESWIDDTVRLIPRMREWINQYYPGTQLAVGEWSWGGETSMSGALAVADVLGIFGREGVDLASYWTFPPIDSPAAQAFQVYTHYNARGDAFGDRAISAEVDASPDYVTCYASVDSMTQNVVLVVVNKRYDADVPATIDVGLGGVAEVYRYAASDPAIQPTGMAVVTGGQVNVRLPAASISVVRFRRG